MSFPVSNLSAGTVIPSHSSSSSAPFSLSAVTSSYHELETNSYEESQRNFESATSPDFISSLFKDQKKGSTQKSRRHKRATSTYDCGRYSKSPKDYCDRSQYWAAQSQKVKDSLILDSNKLKQAFDGVTKQANKLKSDANAMYEKSMYVNNEATLVNNKTELLKSEMVSLKDELFIIKGQAQLASTQAQQYFASCKQYKAEAEASKKEAAHAATVAIQYSAASEHYANEAKQAKADAERAEEEVAMMRKEVLEIKQKMDDSGFVCLISAIIASGMAFVSTLFGLSTCWIYKKHILPAGKNDEESMSSSETTSQNTSQEELTSENSLLRN